jgi:hypothetical protein
MLPFLKTTMSRLNSHTTHGVLIAISNLLQGVMQRYDLKTTREYMWIEISVTGNLDLIGNHYFPSDCNVTLIDSYLTFLTKFSSHGHLLS